MTYLFNLFKEIKTAANLRFIETNMTKNIRREIYKWLLVLLLTLC